MKIRALACLLLLYAHAAQAGINNPGSSSGAAAPVSRSEVSLNNLGAEFEFLNLMKGAVNWLYSNNTGSLKPDEVDSNGNPLSGKNWTTQSGAKTIFNSPSQAERPGHYVLSWVGSGKNQLNINNGGTSTGISCSGTASNLAGPFCDNTGCSSFTASIAGTTLTVTVAPTGTGCTLGVGVPISGASVLVSTFGVPTIISSAGSACGGNTCYTVNQSQAVGSETMSMGGRLEVSTTDTTINTSQWLVQLATTNGNTSSYAVYHLSDEAAYLASATPCGSGKGCLVGSLFKTRIQQANFKILRDLDLSVANVSSCTTWATRKPAAYFSYTATEMRNAASAPGQYVNSGGTGASGGTISYNGGTDVYSITLGSGAPVDKQTIVFLPPSTGTASSKISLNGNTSVPILTPFGLALSTNTNFVPQSGKVGTLVYDATLAGFMNWGDLSQGDTGLKCGIPPEVFVELVAELGKTPWHVPGVMSLDPMTDWVTQYATYIKNNYSPPSLPIFEAVNEPWNCAGGPYNSYYLSAKSTVYISQDSNHAWASGLFCGSSGNNNSEIGKIASTMGQDLKTALGAGNYELLTPVQTYWNGSSTFSDVLLSAAFIGQSMSAQAGYTQIAAYTVATRVSVNNYWHTGYQATAGLEVGSGYCYFNYSISTACQGAFASQAAVMTSYMNTATATSCGTTTCNDNNIARLVGFYLPQWQTFGNLCASGSRPGNCTVNASFPLMMYEGGFDPTNLGADVTQSFTTASNAATAVLTIANNGCVAGQIVALSALSGGTWSGAAGSYTVQSSGTDSGHCAINLNSTGLGALSAATLTYTGSQGYVNYTRAAAYTAPEQDTLVSNLYASVVSDGGVNPSQYQLASGGLFGQNNSWYLFAFDIYGYYPLGQCTGCTIASTTLTLGGTITGVFRVGDTLFGGGVTGPGTGAGSQTTITSCTPVGGNVCGTASGDTLGLSQASTIASGTTMTDNATPGIAGSGTASPVRAFHAICNWNGNGPAC